MLWDLGLNKSHEIPTLPKREARPCDLASEKLFNTPIKITIPKYVNYCVLSKFCNYLFTNFLVCVYLPYSQIVDFGI